MEQQTLLSLLQCNNTACNNVLDNTSKLLPCQHTLCLECLENRVRLTRFWRCPECKKSVGKNICDLPTNIWINRLLESKHELNIDSQTSVLTLPSHSPQLSPTHNTTPVIPAATTVTASPPSQRESISTNRTSILATHGPRTRLRARRLSQIATVSSVAVTSIASSPLAVTSVTASPLAVTSVSTSPLAVTSVTASPVAVLSSSSGERTSDQQPSRTVSTRRGHTAQSVSSSMVTRSQARRKAREAAEKKNASNRVSGEMPDSQTTSQCEVANSEERKKTLKKCMTVLVHSCHCTEIRCRIKNCMKMKYVQAHARVCSTGLSGGCSICKNFKILCLYHAKHCQLDSDSCRVPLCQTLKTKLQEFVVAFIGRMPSAVGKLLECAICLQTLDHTNKYLPCQHTFHRRCLEKLLETLNATKCVFCQSSMFRCPECRTEVASRVTELPANLCMSRLLHSLRLRVQSEWQATANAARATTTKAAKRKKSCRSSSAGKTEMPSAGVAVDTEEASVSVNVLPTLPKTRRVQD